MFIFSLHIYAKYGQIQIDSHYIQNIIADKTFVIFKPNDQTFMTVSNCFIYDMNHTW